jgi:predicted cupin superfamily sugar epimerase
MHRLIKELGLQVHPEGGYYRECYRSATQVRSNDRDRNATTLIYYLLEAGSYSAWHRVTSDEIWHFYEGDGLELLSMDPECRKVHVHTLDQNNRHAVIAAGHWQAARPLGTYALMACAVSPGFDFADFLLLREHPRQTYLAAAWHDLL